MEKGKNKVDPIAEEEERRLLKALGDFAIISKQGIEEDWRGLAGIYSRQVKKTFNPLGEFHAHVQKTNEWMEQHTARSNGLHLEGAETAFDAEESVSALQARATELVDILWKFERDLQDGYYEASTSGSSRAADHKPEEHPLAEQKPEVPPADPKPEPSSP